MCSLKRPCARCTGVVDLLLSAWGLFFPFQCLSSLFRLFWLFLLLLRFFVIMWRNFLNSVVFCPIVVECLSICYKPAGRIRRGIFRPYWVHRVCLLGLISHITSQSFGTLHWKNNIWQLCGYDNYSARVVAFVIGFRFTLVYLYVYYINVEE